MPNDTRPTPARAVDRRTLLQLLAGVGVLGTAAAGANAAVSDDDDSGDDVEDGSEEQTEGADRRYVFEQGDDRFEVTPLSGDESVESFYDLRIPEKYVGDNGATDPGEGPYYMSVGTQDLQRPSTSLLFFYDGPNGVSLVAVHDANGDDGGSATWTVSGVPESAEWLVKDDFYLFESGEKPDSNYDNWDIDGTTHEIDWTWGATRGDGGALGYLDRGTSLEIDPAFNEAAALYGRHYEGQIDEWQVLSTDGDGVERFTLDLDERVTAAVEQFSSSEDTPFDLDVAPPDGRINVESEGLIAVEISCPDPSAIDVDSITFGAPEAVDDGDGAAPEHDGHVEDGVCKVHFRVDETEIEPETARAKLVGETDGESDQKTSFSLTDAIDAFDPTDDRDEGEDDDRDEDEDEGDEKEGEGGGDEDGEEEEAESEDEAENEGEGEEDEDEGEGEEDEDEGEGEEDEEDDDRGGDEDRGKDENEGKGKANGEDENEGKGKGKGRGR